MTVENCSILWYLDDELIVIIWYIVRSLQDLLHIFDFEWWFFMCFVERDVEWAISSGFSKAEIPISIQMLSNACIHS